MHSFNKYIIMYNLFKIKLAVPIDINIKICSK